jgi:hypothetical protein
MSRRARARGRPDLVEQAHHFSTRLLVDRMRPHCVLIDWAHSRSAYPGMPTIPPAPGWGNVTRSELQISRSRQRTLTRRPVRTVSCTDNDVRSDLFAPQYPSRNRGPETVNDVIVRRSANHFIVNRLLPHRNVSLLRFQTNASGQKLGTRSGDCPDDRGCRPIRTAAITVGGPRCGAPHKSCSDGRRPSHLV